MYSIHVSLFSLIAYFACILSNRLSASEEFCPCLLQVIYPGTLHLVPMTTVVIRVPSIQGGTKKMGPQTHDVILSVLNRFKKFFHRKIPW